MRYCLPASSKVAVLDLASTFTKFEIMNKVDVVVEIENYHLEMSDYFRKQKIAFMLIIFFPFVGVPWFIKLMKTKKQLDQQRLNIQEMLKQISDQIPFDEYMDMRKRFISVKTY